MDLLRGAAVVALAAGVSCFDPHETDGTLHCGPGGACPSGFECAGDQLCWRSGSSTADGALSPDAADPADAAHDAAPLPACSNGVDDDCDGQADDFDQGCVDANDASEHNGRPCDNGIDDDGDGFIDFHIVGCGPPTDPQCENPEDNED
jgi:hypothetical protein